MEYALTVDGNHLREGLKRFSTRRRKFRKAERTLVGFDGRFASIEALDVVVVAKATGVWPGIASAAVNLAVALAEAPPVGESVRITLRDKRLAIGSLTVTCDWQPVSHELLKLPAAPDWIEALSLKYRATRAQILTGDNRLAIDAAERKLDKLVAKASKLLEPLGVTQQELRLLVDNRLAKRFAPRA